METEQETLMRARYLAMITKSSAPPHCRPVTILILILSAGTMFIGLTMTITAHWPGSVSMRFDPLSIPGPIILGIGGFSFIAGSILVCYFQKKERLKRQKKIVNFATSLSRTNLDMTTRQQCKPLLAKEPSKEGGLDLYSSDRDDEPELSLSGYQKPQIIDEVITTTTTVTTSSSSPQEADDENLPIPVRQTTKKINKQKKQDRLKTMADDEIEENSDFVFPPPPLMVTEIQHHVSKKKKKVRTKHLEDAHQRTYLPDQIPECDDPLLDVEEHKQEVSYSEQKHLKVQIKAQPGTSVSVRHGSAEETVGLDEVDVQQMPPKKRKTKKKHKDDD